MKQKIKHIHSQLHTHPLAHHNSIIVALAVFAFVIPLTMLSGILELTTPTPKMEVPKITSLHQPRKCVYKIIPCSDNSAGTCSSYVLSCPSSLKTTQVAQNNALPTGLLQNADCKSIAGWAYNQDAPGRIMDVQLYYDGPIGQGHILANTWANKELDDNDVVQLFGAHEFSYPLPAILKDGAIHTIYSYATDSSASAQEVELLGSPKTISCEPTTFLKTTPYLFPTQSKTLP